jgi:hypothetical protein
MAKFILGTIYLDGTDFHYNCEKGVKYFSHSLSNTDVWTVLFILITGFNLICETRIKKK